MRSVSRSTTWRAVALATCVEGNAFMRAVAISILIMNTSAFCEMWECKFTFKSTWGCNINIR